MMEFATQGLPKPQGGKLFYFLFDYETETYIRNFSGHRMM